MPVLSLKKIRLLILAVALTGWTAGCGREGIRVYRIAKTRPASPFAVPDGWTQKPRSGMRAASFQIVGPDQETGEVSVLPMRGLAISDLEIVNLWREQIGLPRIDQTQLPNAVAAVRIGGRSGKLLDLVRSATTRAKDAKRIIGAFVHDEDQTWFFKMTGSASTVAAHRDRFMAFLDSVNLPLLNRLGLDTRPTSQAPRAPAGTPPLLPGWNVPKHWKASPPSAMLLAKYEIPGDGLSPAATVTVSAFPGTAGGLLANVNRWRRQLDLAPVSEETMSGCVTAMEVQGHTAHLVELQGANTAILAAIVSRESRTWFYKLMGDASRVATEKAAFIEFVKTAKYQTNG